MAKIIINAESFIATGRTARDMEVGTVEVNGVAQKAVRTDTGVIYVHGYVGRYRTASKAWNAVVGLREGQLMVDFGRDDRCGRFNKQNAISFEPQTFDLAANALYWDAI